MITPLFLHINMPHNRGLIEIYLINSIRLPIISLAAKNYHWLWLLNFNHGRALYPLRKLVWQFAPFTVSLWVSLYDSGTLVVSSTSAEQVNVVTEFYHTCLWSRHAQWGNWWPLLGLKVVCFTLLQDTRIDSSILPSPNHKYFWVYLDRTMRISLVNHLRKL